MISEQLNEISNLQDIIEKMITILYEKMVTIGFSDIEVKDGIDQINFMFDITDPTVFRTFIKSNNSIL